MREERKRMKNSCRMALVVVVVGMLVVPAGVASRPNDPPSPLDGIEMLYHMFHAYRYRCGAPEYMLRLEYRLRDSGVDGAEQTLEQRNRSLEVLRRRLDYLDAVYADVYPKGEDGLVVSLAGPQAVGVTELKELLGTPAKLEFMMVDDDARFFEGLATPLSEFVKLLPESAPSLELDGSGMYRTVKCSDEQTLRSFVAWLGEQGLVGDDHVLLIEEGADWDANGVQASNFYEARYLHDKVWLSNSDIASAHVLYGYNGEPQVNLQFTVEAGHRFEQLTRDNVERRLAIVLDDRVSSAPVIREAISGGRAVITLGYGSPQKQLQEATNLARTLKSGAYLVPLDLVSERVQMSISSHPFAWRQVLCEPSYLLGPFSVIFKPWAQVPPAFKTDRE